MAGKADDLKQGAAIAAASLDNGKAVPLNRMIEISHEVIVDPEEEGGDE